MASPELLFRGARVVDPAGGRDGVADVHVRDGVVAALGPGLDAASAEVLDCDGLVLAPGLVDMHTHLREPGFEHKETVETGARAAAAGGYTAVCAMPNTDPVADNVAIIAEVRALADSGLALVTLGRVAEGFGRLDEALAAITAGEVRDPAVAGVAFCSMLSSCDRTGDVKRAQEWTRLAWHWLWESRAARPFQIHE